MPVASPFKCVRVCVCAFVCIKDHFLKVKNGFQGRKENLFLLSRSCNTLNKLKLQHESKVIFKHFFLFCLHYGTN